MPPVASRVSVCTHFTVRVGVWVQGEGHGGTRLSGRTRRQLLRHRKDPQAVRKSASPLCATSPSQRRGEGHGGGGGGGGEQHRATLALPVARSIVPVGARRLEGRASVQKAISPCLCGDISSPGVSVVPSQAGLAVGSLGVVGAVALARLVVTVTSGRVAVAVALALHTAAAAAATGQGRPEAARAAVLAVGSHGPV